MALSVALMCAAFIVALMAMAIWLSLAIIMAGKGNSTLKSGSWIHIVCVLGIASIVAAALGH